MRIAMVCMSPNPLVALGGADAQGRGGDVHALSMALAARGHEVVLHTRRDNLHMAAEVRLGPGVTVHHVDAGPLHLLPAEDVVPFMPRFAGELAQRWLDEPPDVAHAHFWDSGVVSAQAAAAAGVPIALTFHTLGAFHEGRLRQSGSNSQMRVDVELSLAQCVGQVIASSGAQSRELLLMGTPSDHLVVVPHGVDTTQFSPNGSEASRGSRHHRLLALGELSLSGGVDDAIRMVAQVPVAELVVAGGPPPADLDTDPDVARLRLLAQELAVTNRVGFLGDVPRADLPALIRSADIVVCLPRYEMSVRVALEAMACGRPIVASTARGLLDVVDDGVTGLLVQPQSPSAAALAVRRLLGAPGLRAAMSEYAWIRAQTTFDWRHVARMTEQVYQAMSVDRHIARPPAACPSVPPADQPQAAKSDGAVDARGRS